MAPLQIRGVKIGDKFIDTCNRKSRIVSTVIDFIERKSLTTGEVVGHEIIAEHEFLGQKLKTSPVAVTVLRNKIQ